MQETHNPKPDEKTIRLHPDDLKSLSGMIGVSVWLAIIAADIFLMLAKSCAK